MSTYITWRQRCFFVLDPTLGLPGTGRVFVPDDFPHNFVPGNHVTRLDMANRLVNFVDLRVKSNLDAPEGPWIGYNPPVVQSVPFQSVFVSTTQPSGAAHTIGSGGRSVWSHHLVLDRELWREASEGEDPRVMFQESVVTSTFLPSG